MPRGPRLGILGGTFDPFHNGHLVAACEARHQLGLDRVVLVVANRPWQKEAGREITSGEDRFAMVKAGTAGVAGVEASTIEIDRGGLTYTFDTVEALTATEPGAEIVLIIGTDVAAELGTWHRVDELRSAVSLGVVSRDGDAAPGLLGWRVTPVTMPALAISSTDIRQRLADGRPIEGLVPAAVVKEIRERRLYP
ncbi:MAG: nicotinate-nucleotide adenylyltransferase [Acidimicrobiales bacterium]